MSQRPVRVTLKSNIRDIGEDDYELIDPEDVGYLDKIFAFRESVAEGKIKTLIRALVFWELRPCPAPAYEDPADLHWLDSADREYFNELDEEIEEVDEEVRMDSQRAIGEELEQ